LRQGGFHAGTHIEEEEEMKAIGIALRRLGLLAGALAAGMGLAGLSHAAESYPSRPVRLIVPFPPGGSTDFNARAIADKFSGLLGQQLVIDNRAGASGVIGTGLAKRAAPDGYTLLLHTVPFVTGPILNSRAGYDPVQDFAPISLLSTVAMAISVHPSVPAKSVKELLALAKKRPGDLNYGSAGIGTNSHITGELFNLLGKTGIVPIHFKGGGPALAAVVTGEVQVAFSNIPQTLVMVKAGRLRPLAVSSLQPSAALPGIPPVTEAGLPGFEFVTWHGMLAPKGTPASIVTLLNEKVRATIGDAAMTKRFQQSGMDAVTTTPQEYAAYLVKEQEKWGRVIRERNIKAE
jgi:tripartite-type tricarboxylate transporter receptor subunit TctC